jgi:uncharacterized protein
MYMSLDDLQTSTVPILKRYGVKFAGVFGSYARNEAQTTSDLDILVSLSAPIGVFALARLRRELEEVTGKTVDLVTTSALNSRISPYVYADLREFAL